MRHYIYLIIIALALLAGCGKTMEISHGDLLVEFNQKLHSRINHAGSSSGFSDSFTPSEYLVTWDGPVSDFIKTSMTSESISDQIGSGTRYELKGQYKNGETVIDKEIIIRLYDDFPGTMIYNVIYSNNGNKNITILKWVNHHHSMNKSDQAAAHDFWSFQGSSTGARADWILPLANGFYQKNYMGMNNSDYGGGIPVADIWRNDAGIATGHLEMTPQLVSLPVQYKEYDNAATLMIMKEFEEPLVLAPGETISTIETFIMVHQGDCYNSLGKYSDLMQAKGLQFTEPEEAAFEPVWCAWGYERNFTVKEIEGTLAKVKELGIEWAVIDDGFQQAEGDWDVNREKFPGGSADMKRLVDKIHSHGLKAKIWWAPLAVDPGSKLFAENPDIILYTEDWAPQYITWWDAYYMAPTYNKTIQHTREVVRMFMDEWGIDGLKLDGQHMNAVPPDHHPDHGLEYPEQAVEQLPQFFHTIYKTARTIKPEAVIENCPCGCCMSYYNMTSINQAVSSDPLSSWQIRLKGKVYKALVPHVAYYGDHVELSDNASDFASSFGIGAVPGTKFTWPADNPTASDSYLLTPEKEVIWKKWFSLYNEMMLSREKYLGHLYDIGFDKPETHVIQKNDALYYAFYSNDWSGKIELRGLEKDQEYHIFDYVNEKDLGTVSGNDPWFEADFESSLLIAVGFSQRN